MKKNRQNKIQFNRNKKQIQTQKLKQNIGTEITTETVKQKIEKT